MNTPDNNAEKLMMALLQAGLWNSDAPLQSIRPATDDCWAQVYTLARRQTVSGIVFRGIEKLNDEQLPNDTLLMLWAADAENIARANRKMNATASSLDTLFTTHGLHPVHLKGQGIAQSYDTPELRQPGDIDLYFPTREEQAAARAIIAKQGIKTSLMPDGSTHYLFDGIEVEHHPTLFDLDTPAAQRHLKEIEKRHGYTRTSIGKQESVTTPAPLPNILQLNSHILKHTMGKGVGLRQLCDSARAYHTHSGTIDSYEIKEIYRQTGLERWSKLLHSYLVTHLGMPIDTLPYPETPVATAPLARIIMAGGNFGHYRHGNRAATTTVRRKLHTAGTFLHNLRFSCHYAPQEALWRVLNLIKGQFKC